MSALSQIAKDPSCLLAVDALQGGRWLSCIRPDGVQPSSVPRNFAEEPSTWYDAVVAGYAAIGDHDCEFEISYKNDVDYPGQIFYSNSQDGSINLNFMSGNQNSFSSFRAFNTQSASLVIPIDAGVQNSGSHTVKFKRQNGTAEAWVDGQLVKSVTSDLGNKTLYANSMPLSQFDGNIFYIRLTDLTTGKIVWSYPSWEERTRLLTFNNIITTGGVFHAANDANIAGIATPLDFRGNTTSKTFIVRAFCPAHDPDSNRLYLHPLIGQGNIGTGATGFTFHLSIREDRQSGVIQVYPVVSNGSVFYSAYADASELLDSWHVFAFSIEHLPESAVLRSFVDGAQVGSSSAPAFAWGTPTATTTQETTVGIRRDPNSSYYAGSLTIVSAALIFDRALTQPEIAAISNTMG